MIDLHNHILHGLDEGPETLEESLEMCRIGYDDGIRTIVATPHVLKGVYENSRTTILAALRELNKTIGNRQRAIGNGQFNPGQLSNAQLPNDSMTQLPNDSFSPSCPSPSAMSSSFPSDLSCPRSSPLVPLLGLNILPGAEVHLDSELLQDLRQDRLMTLGDGRRSLLVEFPSQTIPSQTEEVLFQLMAMRVKPIITHPERNLEIRKRPKRYYDMILSGCMGQVTGISLTGGFGPEVKRLAQKMLLHRLVHVIATDAHSADGRPPILSEAVAAASKILGREEAQRMVIEYPQAILEGRKPEVPRPISL